MSFLDTVPMATGTLEVPKLDFVKELKLLLTKSEWVSVLVKALPF